MPSKDIIDVSAFCNTDEIDPLYFEKHYYLEAEKAGQRPFNLQELAMAENLIDLLAEDFDPDKCTDRYREALLKMINEKLEGQPVQREKARQTQGEVVDLLEALQMSVNSAKSGAILKRQSADKANNTKSTDEKIVQIS